MATAPRPESGRLPSSVAVPNDPDDESLPGIDRLLALTDGVVAIALTLLVLQLQVPALVDNQDSARTLWHALDVDGSELTSYLVSFVVIAQFWLVHHRVLRSMRGHSEALAWRNFGFLLTLTLMPFTSDLLGRYGSNPLAITFFGINLVAISLTTQWIFVYAAHHQLLTDAAPFAARRIGGPGPVSARHRHRGAVAGPGVDRHDRRQVRLAALPARPGRGSPDRAPDGADAGGHGRGDGVGAACSTGPGQLSGGGPAAG